jgi:5-methylcytosine-specific restriction endonuclease McrA
MKCTSCEEDFAEKDIHEHHIRPRFMDNLQGLGRKRLLCKKCHDIMHNSIQGILWRYVPIENRRKCIMSVELFCERYKRGNK